MNNIHKYLLITGVIFTLVISGCPNDTETGNLDSDGQTVTRGEHDRGGGEHDGDVHTGDEVEESGTELALSQTYDNVRNGARLILAYDAESNTFNGTVENTTDNTLRQVRVEVHLSNGKELGPTVPADLEPGKKIAVRLTAINTAFDRWTAHPEVGSGEHGSGEGRGEHGREGSGEHN